MSKVSLPNPTILKFYYNFSTFTLILTWILAPFVFYIILTQSKNLKNFKWFLLNHTFWSLLLETVIGIFKPVMLLPSFSFYLETFENPRITLTVIFLILLFAFICIFSVIVTILNRYFTIFPSFKFLNTRNFIIFGVGCSVVTLTPYIAIYIVSVFKDLNNFYQNSIEYDPFFKQLNEPSLIFIPEKYWRPYVKGIFIGFSINFILSFLGFIYFVYLVRTHLTASVAKLQKTLFISAFIQNCITFTFLILPILVLAFLAFFEIPNSASDACILFSIVSVHSLLDFLIILSVVTPYRKFIVEKFNKIFNRKKQNIIRVTTVFAASEYERQRN